VISIKSLKFRPLQEVLFFHDLEGIFDMDIDIGWQEKSEFLKQIFLFISKNLGWRKLQWRGFVRGGKLHVSSIRNKIV
jgi:hypothetical protein